MAHDDRRRRRRRSTRSVSPKSSASGPRWTRSSRRPASRAAYDEFAKFLRTSPQFYFTDAASLLTAYRDIAKRADPELAHLFGRLPQTPYGVKAVPDAIAPSQTTAYYEPGSLAAGRPGEHVRQHLQARLAARSGRWKR